MKILSTTILPIALLIPQRCYGVEAPAAAGAIADKIESIDPIGPIDGESAPDFGELDSKYGGDDKGAPEVIKPAEREEVRETRQEREAKAKKAQDEEAKRQREEQVDDEPDKEEEAKKAAAEAEKTKAKAKEEKPKEDKKDEPKSKHDELTQEIDSLEIRQGASEKTRLAFERAREVAKQEIATNKQLTNELETLKKEVEQAKTATAPEEIQKQLDDLMAERDQLVKFRQMVELENDPEISKAHLESLQQSETNFFGFLKSHPQIGLSEANQKLMEEAGMDSPEGEKLFGEWLGRIGEIAGPIAQARALRLWEARQDVIEGHKAQINKLRTEGGEFVKAQEERRKQEFDKWGKGVDAAWTPEDLAMFKFHEEEGTPEQIAAAKASNAELQNVRKEYLDIGAKLFNRDSATFVKVAKTYLTAEKAIRESKEQITAKDEEIKSLKQQVEQLTTEAAGVKRITRARPSDTPTVKPTTGIDEDAEAAIDNYRKQTRGGNVD